MAPAVVERLCAFLFIFVIVSVTVLFVFAGILCSVVKPFSNPLYLSIITTLSELDWYMLTAAWELWGKAKIHWHGDIVPPRESALIVSNHRTLFDWLIILSLGTRKGRVGQCMFFQKDIIKYFPGFGWGCYVLGHPFLKRNWTEDAKTIAKTFDSIHRRNLPVYLTSYCEGSRFKQERYLQSKAYLEKVGKPPLNHVLCPHSRGFIATLNELRDDVVDVVYDLTIQFEGNVSLASLALRQGFEVHVHVKRHPVESIPRKDNEIADWLFDQWQAKDKLMAHYEQHGRFPGDELDEPYRIVSSQLSFRVMEKAEKEARKERNKKL